MSKTLNLLGAASVIGAAHYFSNGASTDFVASKINNVMNTTSGHALSSAFGWVADTSRDHLQPALVSSYDYAVDQSQTALSTGLATTKFGLGVVLVVVAGKLSEIARTKGLMSGLGAVSVLSMALHGAMSNSTTDVDWESKFMTQPYAELWNKYNP